MSGYLKKSKKTKTFVIGLKSESFTWFFQLRSHFYYRLTTTRFCHCLQTRFSVFTFVLPLRDHRARSSSCFFFFGFFYFTFFKCVRREPTDEVCARTKSTYKWSEDRECSTYLSGESGRLSVSTSLFVINALLYVFVCAMFFILL